MTVCVPKVEKHCSKLCHHAAEYVDSKVLEEHIAPSSEMKQMEKICSSKISATMYQKALCYEPKTTIFTAMKTSNIITLNF